MKCTIIDRKIGNHGRGRWGEIIEKLNETIENIDHKLYFFFFFKNDHYYILLDLRKKGWGRGSIP